MIDTVPNFLQNSYSAFLTGVVKPPPRGLRIGSHLMANACTTRFPHPSAHRPTNPFFSCNRTTPCPLVRVQRPRHDRWATRTLPPPNLDYWQAFLPGSTTTFRVYASLAEGSSVKKFQELYSMPSLGSATTNVLCKVVRVLEKN
jgi:hypothetical protein